MERMQHQGKTPVDSDTRALVSQVKHALDSGKLLTIANIVQFGSGRLVLPTPGRVEKMKEQLAGLVKQGYVQMVNNQYRLTQAGAALSAYEHHESYRDPRIAKRRGLEYGKAIRNTRVAVGTRPPETRA